MEHTKEPWEHIADTMDKCGVPLTDDQRIVIAGSVTVWVDKYKQQRDELLAAAENLIRVKGRHHTEQAYKQLEAAVDAVAKVKP